MKRDWIPLYAAISTSAKLANLVSDAHRLFYTWLLPQCDSWGRIEADPRVLGAKVWPMLEKTAEETRLAMLDCIRVGLLVILEAPGVVWIEAPDWDQKAGAIGQFMRDRGVSKFPEVGQPRGTLGLACELTNGSQGNPAERKVEEKRAEESRGEQTAPVKPARVRKPATGDHAELIRHWEAEWTRTRLGQMYAVEAKDGVAVAAVLKLASGSLREAQERATRLLESSDAWMAQNASLPLLRSKWNQLAVTISGPTGAMDALWNFAHQERPKP